MNILIYRSNYQYGVVDLFIDDIIDAFRTKKHNIAEFDLNQNDATQKLINVFTHSKFDLVIGFGGVGCDITVTSNESIYDVLNTNYLSICIDHPAVAIGRVLQPIKNYLISFIDKSHVDYVNEVLPHRHKLNFFLPHGAMNLYGKYLDFESYKRSKEIDILFTGTFMGYPEKPWAKSNDFPKYILDEISELLIYDDNYSIHEAFNFIFEKEKIKFSSISKVQIAGLISIMNTYIRQYKRVTLVSKLIEKVGKITICGNKWEDFSTKNENIDYRGPLPIQDTLQLINKSKIIINISPNFNHGSHERVFTGMLNYALLFSDKSSYLEETFLDNDTILYYNFKSLDSDIDRMINLLKDDKKLYKMTSKAYAIAKDKHTWTNRVDKIIEMLSLSMIMDS